MKYLVILYMIFVVQMTEAQSCAPVSKEMAQYTQQAKWRQHSVEGGSGVPALQGFIDEQNNFYFSDLTRGGSIEASLDVDSLNRNFFKYCREGKISYLRSMRRSGENNTYRLKMRYLPSLSGFANNPLVTQNYSESEAKINLTFDSSSSIDSLESFPSTTKRKLFDHLNSQIKLQKEVGVIELDLSGWDDVACDAMQGRVRIWLSRIGLSSAPLVDQNKEIDPAELSLTYRTLRDQVSQNIDKEKTIFMASRAIAKLEGDRHIGDWAEKRGFDVLKKFMNPEMSRIVAVDEAGLSCMVNQLQSYKRPLVQNIINVQFKLPSLDAVEGR